MNAFCVLLVLVSIGLFNVTHAGKKRKTYWTENFEAMAPGNIWRKSLDHTELTTIVKDTSIDGTPTKAVQIKYLKDKFGKASRVRYKAFVQPADAYVAEFDVKFVKGFHFNLGGKIAGLCGGSCTAGCKQRAVDGWSSRFVWKDGNKLKVYVYDQDRPDNSKSTGKKRNCGHVYDMKFSAKEGEWIKLKMEVRINTPNQHDGVINAWVNGELKFSSDQFRFRGATNGGLVDLFYFTTFYGGSKQIWAPHRDSFARFDNFNVRQPDS